MTNKPTNKTTNKSNNDFNNPGTLIIICVLIALRIAEIGNLSWGRILFFGISMAIMEFIFDYISSYTKYYFLNDNYDDNNDEDIER
jgi:hypothetical protein